MGTPLIAARELAELLQSESTRPVLLDTRWRLGGPPGFEEYGRGHIPTAVYVDLDTNLAAPVTSGSGRHPLPDPATLERDLRSFGVRQDSAVVVYDDSGSTTAARAWWLLRWSGLSNVRVLDGGLKAWVAAGYDTTTDVPAPTEGDVVVRPGGLPTLTVDEAATFSAGGVLLDARSAERYRGETEPVDPVAGHIPGATTANTVENIDADGRFLPTDELRARFTALGVAPGVEVGAYCGSGVTAAHTVLALELIGVEAALYPGSWSSWITDPQRPVARGAELP
jgi:thiosulfate/3-mercaptopyruvate sulfurtransferase